MRRETFARRRYAALLAASAAGLAAFALIWQVLRPTPAEPAQVIAVIRERGLLDNQRQPEPEAVFAELLSPKCLKWAGEQAGLLMNDAVSIERLREQLRVDLGKIDEAGVQTIAIRWTSVPSGQAVELVNVLARRCLEALTRTDAEPHESSHTAAQRAVHSASQELNDARTRLASAVARAHASRAVESAPVAPPGEPTLAPRLASTSSSQRNDRLFSLQQLADLENRRLALSDRLMPEHPEMKALDEKIVALRSSLAGHLNPEADDERELASHQNLPPPARSASNDGGAIAAELGELGGELLAAQAKHVAALERERKCWNLLSAARNRSIAEIEPATSVVVAPARGWQSTFAAAVSGLLTGGLVFLLWPVRRLTFNTVEEVRAITRLPVIAISRHSLN